VSNFFHFMQVVQRWYQLSKVLADLLLIKRFFEAWFDIIKALFQATGANILIYDVYFVVFYVINNL